MLVCMGVNCGWRFNSFIRGKERKGVSVRSRRGEMLEFRNFIEDLNWVDVPSIGGIFTWFNGDGSSMSRLDRFLFPRIRLLVVRLIVGQYVGQRDISDHCPIWLKASDVD